MQALSSVFPRVLAKLVVLEFRIYSVILSCFKKRFELLIPANLLFLKILLLVLTVWGLLHLTGLYLGVAKFGHSFQNDGVNIQIGFGLKRFIPYDKIEVVAEKQKELESNNMNPFTSKQHPKEIYGTAGEKCNVMLTFKDVIVFDGIIKHFKPCCTLYLSLEEPSDFVSTFNKCISSQINTNICL